MPRVASTAPRRDDLSTWLIGVVAGGVVWGLGCRPTGSSTVDVVMVPIAVAAAVWLCSLARWWALLALGVVAAGLAGEIWGTALGIGAALIAVGIGLRLVDHPAAPVVGASSAIVALATIGELVRFGVSSAVSIVLVVACCAVGVVDLDDSMRRGTLRVLAVIGGVVLVAAAGLGIAARSARSDFDAANRAVSEGLEQVRDGDTSAAQVSFAEASVLFRSGVSDFRRPWVQLARVVPVAAQHRQAVTELGTAASSTARVLETELAAVDLESLRFEEGRLDIDAVVGLRPQVDRVNDALDRLDRSLDISRSAWLVPSVGDRIDDLSDTVDAQRDLGSRVVDALEIAPAMLGADGERVYLLMFTTPGEARGQGGFMGNYAELTVDDGQISLTDFGRHNDLSERGDRPRTLTSAPADWLDRYGPFGYTTGPNGSVGDVPWANITISPHFPSTAQVVAELYPQSGGRELDGVLNLDVFALDELAALIGPIEVDGAPEPLTGANTASFLLVGQYDIADFDARTDLLEAVALQTIELILGDAAPDPIELARRLRPMTLQRRAMVWSSHPEEQEILSAAGLTAELLDDRDGADGIAVTVVNAGGSKIDTFLARRFTLSERADGRLDLELEFRNDPALQLPDYVVGNLVGLPRGASRLFVSIHTSMRLVEARHGDEPIGLQPSIEEGLPVYSRYLEILPDETVTWVATMEPTDGADLVIQPQPLVQTEVWTVDTPGAPFPWNDGSELFETVRLPTPDQPS